MYFNQKYSFLCSVQSNMCPSAWQLTTHLKSATLPFLRCAAMFFHHLTAVRPPDSLLGKLVLSNVRFETCIFSCAVSTSGVTYLVTMACVWLSGYLYLRGTPPPPEIIRSQKFQNQNVFRLILSNFSGGTPPPVEGGGVTGPPDLA